MGFNYASPLILGFFSINRLENFWDNCDNLKKLADKLHNLETLKKEKAKYVMNA